MSSPPVYRINGKFTVTGLGSEYGYTADNPNYAPYDTFGAYGYYEADFIYEGAMRDTGRGEATPQDDSSYPDNPTDYFTPGEGGINEWGSSSDDGGWLSAADLKFVDGQTTAIPLQISNDGMADGNDTLIWSIDNSAPFGFIQETYIFSEAVDPIIDLENDFDYATVNIELSLGSQIKTATIVVEDTNGVFTRLIGDSNDNPLSGSDGNDIVYAQAGNDYVDSSNGNDDLYGEAGNDTLLGYFGSDYLNGGFGSDYLSGQADDDKLDGLDGDDGLFGEGGNDALLGWYGNDYLDGGDGDDSLDGEADNDTLLGSFGNDMLTDGAGSDMLIGGAGDDNYTVDSTTDTITEYFNEGTDTVESSVSFILGENVENLNLTDGNYISGTGNALNNFIQSFSSRNISLYGGDGNDTLNGYFNDSSDTLTGGAGADTFVLDFFQDGLYRIDIITDFAYWEADKIQVSATRLSIGTGEYNRFTYDINTGALFFDQTQLAWLPIGLDFVPSSDILIV